jgi:methylated-DNA-[protein]-cysteine S-methyltransferase
MQQYGYRGENVGASTIAHMSAYYSSHIDSPIGPLAIVVDSSERLVEISFEGRAVTRGATPDDDRCARAARELIEYFIGERRDFSVAVAPRGTEFQRSVWAELQRIPFGATISYGELARRIGKPRAVRAVGAANGANPIPIVIPCHRVIGSNGKLTGYGGGLDKKEALLAIERGER